MADAIILHVEGTGLPREDPREVLLAMQHVDPFDVASVEGFGGKRAVVVEPLHDTPISSDESAVMLGAVDHMLTERSKLRATG